ncbi:MAG: hypothetical protein L6R42_002661 [Xanthoria sp. 1 TBL-2021]|nr:MAG: hypothetical protein L6R42_002661 [Xanthoria sp. 1 TBL-2021]
MGKDGQVIEPVKVGYPPQENKVRSITPTEAAHKTLVHRKEYIPDGEVYTWPPVRLVATASSGGTEGSEITISKARMVSQSMTFSASLDIGVIFASTKISFEENLEDTKGKKGNILAGQTGLVGFTPTLKCTKDLSPFQPFSSNVTSSDVLTSPGNYRHSKMQQRQQWRGMHRF